MRRLLAGLSLFTTTAFVGCTAGNKTSDELKGTWQSLWDQDIKLQLQLDGNGRFKVTLNRTGQIHNNLGWYNVENGIFSLRDSVDYPLPVCNTEDEGRYRFTLRQDTLQFTLVEDKCERRSTALQLERFVRVD